jgi:hypothetical protein
MSRLFIEIFLSRDMSLQYILYPTYAHILITASQRYTDQDKGFQDADAIGLGLDSDVLLCPKLTEIGS